MNDNNVIKELIDHIKSLEEINKDLNMSKSRRARAISVGTAFGGTSEISMRTEDDASIFCFLQPVEVVELIHQLAGNIGCHIHLQPRKDFASWRDWRLTDEEKIHLDGRPHPVNDMAPFNQLGANGVNPMILQKMDAERIPESGGGRGGMQGHELSGGYGANVYSGDLNEVMATEKPKKRRGTKQSSTPT